MRFQKNIEQSNIKLIVGNVEIRNQQAKVKELCSVIENLILIASKLQRPKRSQKNGYKPKLICITT
jgi:hypothetical protein